MAGAGHGKRRTKEASFPKNVQQNKGGPMSRRPCIAGRASERSPRMTVC